MRILSILTLLIIQLFIPLEAFAKTAYLSFDDGPSNCTEDILNILKVQDVKATFFVTGTASPGHMYLYRKMVKDGHSLGLHSYSHNYSKIYRSTDSFFQDIHHLEKFLEKEVGESPKILRFPGGSNNYVAKQYAGTDLMEQLKTEVVKRGYKFYDWNCDANDGLNPPIPEKKLLKLIMDGVGEKDTLYILLHDFNGNTTIVDGLPEIIRRLKHKGYEFKIMDESTPTMTF